MSTEVEVPLLLTEYREPRQHLFPSEQSLAWFVRQNREALVRAGAIVLHRKKWYVHPAKFDACLFEQGARAAQKKLAGAGSQ